MAKDSHILSTKNNSVFVIFMFGERLDPDWHGTGKIKMASTAERQIKI